MSWFCARGSFVIIPLWLYIGGNFGVWCQGTGQGRIISWFCVRGRFVIIPLWLYIRGNFGVWCQGTGQGRIISWFCVRGRFVIIPLWLYIRGNFGVWCQGTGQGRIISWFCVRGRFVIIPLWLYIRGNFGVWCQGTGQGRIMSWFCVRGRFVFILYDCVSSEVTSKFSVQGKDWAWLCRGSVSEAALFYESFVIVYQTLFQSLMSKHGQNMIISGFCVSWSFVIILPPTKMYFTLKVRFHEIAWTRCDCIVQFTMLTGNK